MTTQKRRVGIEKMRAYLSTQSLDLAELARARDHDPADINDNLFSSCDANINDSLSYISQYLMTVAMTLIITMKHNSQIIIIYPQPTFSCQTHCITTLPRTR